MNVQNCPDQKFVSFLRQLGIDHEQAAVYLFLLQNGPSSVLGISKGIKSGRTKLYPLLEDLAVKQLVVIHERHYGTSYEAQSPEVLEFLVSEKMRKAENLKDSLPAILHNLKGLQFNASTTSKLIEYKGVDGLKQMNYNLSKAQKEFRVYELAGLDKHLGKHFAEKMRARYQERNLTTYDLTNNPKRHTESRADMTTEHFRYIDPKVFTIQFETYIYDNVVGLLSYDQDNIFGVEIHDKRLVDQQRQLFDLVWSQAKQL